MKKDITWKSFRAYVNSNRTKRAFAVIYIALIYNYFFQKIMKNPEWLETFIEEEDFTPIAEDQYECAGGHVWHIDEIVDLWHQTRSAD